MLPPLTLFLQAAYPPDNLDRILEHIRSDHRGTGPNRVANLVLDAIGSPDGQLATTVLDRVLGAAGLFDNVFVGTATLPWQGPGSPYREGMLDAGFRWQNLTLRPEDAVLRGLVREFGTGTPLGGVDVRLRAAGVLFDNGTLSDGAGVYAINYGSGAASEP